MPDTSRQPRRLAPSPKQDREIINVCCSGPRSARAWPSQPGVSLDGPALSCSGTAPPRWSAPLRHQAPDCCREACTRVRGGCASCWARPLAARDCEDSVRAAAPGPLRPPCRALPAIQSGIRGTPRGASLSRSPLPGASSPPACTSGAWALLCVSVPFQGRAAGPVGSPQKMPCDYTGLHLSVFWVTFYFTIVQGRKGSNIYVQAFSQNCRKSIQCLICEQRDKSEIKQLKHQTPPQPPPWAAPNTLLSILPVFA